jgi:hypothetical protein
MDYHGPSLTLLVDAADAADAAGAGERIARVVSERMARETRHRTPRSERDPEFYDVDAPHLADRIFPHRVRRRGRRWTGGAWTDVDYAPFVEYDTRPHEIRARPGGALRFPVGGMTVFAARVQHPGTKGHHMFRARRRLGGGEPRARRRR